VQKGSTSSAVLTCFTPPTTGFGMVSGLANAVRVPGSAVAEASGRNGTDRRDWKSLIWRALNACSGLAKGVDTSCLLGAGERWNRTAQ
jgi:hypothetical protein